jgi:DNA-binding response OmpR family regulator
MAAVLRRAAGPSAGTDGTIELGPIRLDPAKRVATVGGTPVDLTPREYELLKTLLANEGRLVTKQRLLRAVWGRPTPTRATTSTSTSAACGGSSRRRPRRGPRGG